MVSGSWQSADQFSGLTANWTDTAGETPAFIIAGEPALQTTRIRITVSVPLLNYERVLIPDCGRHYINSLKALDIRSGLFRITAPNAGHPFFALADELGAFYFAFGVLSATGEVDVKRILPTISARRAMVGGDQRLALAFEWAVTPAREHRIELFAVTERPTWFHALRSFTDHIRQSEELVYPRHPDAFEPVWCTWTAFPSAEMTDERVLDNARLARDLGMRSIILDDGWFGPGLDDDHAGPIIHGDYTPDSRKFPDLKHTIAELHDMDMRCLLWHAPLCVAPASDTHAHMRDLLIHQVGQEYLSPNGLAQLCPQCAAVRQYVADETTRLLQTYNADGLKIDLFNCLPDTHCDNPHHPHDIDDPLLALDATMHAIWQSARSYSDDALIELKQDYGNARLIRHGTMVRAGDTAYDMDSNLQRCAYTQAFAHCVHVDPLVTSIHTRPLAMSVMMIKTIIGGVPTFSMDLPAMPVALRDVIAAWLGFYNANRAMFELPRRPQTNAMDVWQGGSHDCAWLALVGQAHAATLPDARNVWIMNATARSSITLAVGAPVDAEATLYHPLPNAQGVSRSWSSTSHQLELPPGSLIHLERKD